ncbi:hypothetical protein TWF730_005755 [Orbilia blumenaviensis]|uniref:RRM domain-containing protein n=1 Tax=Orbilia blumenaviensis TaxID=1796055 RepID=A0AAV9VM50_9PEZI
MANTTAPSVSLAQSSSTNNTGESSSDHSVPSSGNPTDNTRSFPFSGSENVFVPTTFGGSDPMGSASSNPLNSSIGGLPGLQVGYVPDFQVPATGMEITTTRPPPPPAGHLTAGLQANGTNRFIVGTVLPQHVTNALRGGAEGKIIEYYCVPEANRDIGIIPTRHLKCTGVPGETSPSSLKVFFEQFGDISGLFIEKLMSHGFIYVSFFNLQASIQCFRDLQMKWPAVYCVRTTLENVVNNFAAHPLTTEGEVQVDVLNGHCDTQSIVGALGAIGDLHTVQTYRKNEVSTVFAEFYDLRHAASAIHHLSGQKVDGLEIRVSWPDVERVAWTKASQMIEIHEDQNVCVVHAGSTQLVNDARRLYGIPFGSHGHGQDHTHNHYGGPNAPVRGRPNALGLYEPDPSPPRYDIGMINRNILDLQNIRNGVDLRTTIMIRNIPNHLPQSVIKAWLDEVSYRKYDFLYLRIDFANHWSQFGSEKLVEVSYANIQGKAALIEKFRNSSVMDQPFEFRPRAFHSIGENFGLDMEFPPPNNLNRKLRSVTAAEHSGLYNPRHRNNGYGYNSPGRFNGYGHNRGRGYNNNYGNRNYGNGNGNGFGNGMVRAQPTNRLAITLPGYEPQPAAQYQGFNRTQGNTHTGSMISDVIHSDGPIHNANGFVGTISVNNNGGRNTLAHIGPTQISPPPQATAFGGQNAITSPGRFQPAAMYPTPSDTITRSESRLRQENVPPRPRSDVRSQGHPARPPSTLRGAGMPSPGTTVVAASPAPRFSTGNANGNPQFHGPQTPSMAGRFNARPGGEDFSIYNSPLSPAGLVNAGFVPSNPAPPGFGASTFDNAFNESTASGPQNARATSPTDYNIMARNIDAIRRIWEQ